MGSSSMGILARKLAALRVGKSHSFCMVGGLEDDEDLNLSWS